MDVENRCDACDIYMLYNQSLYRVYDSQFLPRTIKYMHVAIMEMPLQLQ